MGDTELVHYRLVITRRGDIYEIRLIDDEGNVAACNDAARVADLVGAIVEAETGEG